MCNTICQRRLGYVYSPSGISSCILFGVGAREDIQEWAEKDGGLICAILPPAPFWRWCGQVRARRGEWVSMQQWVEVRTENLFPVPFQPVGKRGCTSLCYLCFSCGSPSSFCLHFYLCVYSANFKRGRDKWQRQALKIINFQLAQSAALLVTYQALFFGSSLSKSCFIGVQNFFVEITLVAFLGFEFMGVLLYSST